MMAPAVNAAPAQYAFRLVETEREPEGFVWFEIRKTGVSSAFLHNTKMAYISHFFHSAISDDEASINGRRAGSTSSIAHC